jgi:hypothetical protein
MLAGVYGIGFGGLMVPTGLFVGPRILVAALAHFCFGAGFIVSVQALDSRPAIALRMAFWLSLIIAVLALSGVVASIQAADYSSSVFWCCTGLYFGMLGVYAAYLRTWKLEAAS